MPKVKSEKTSRVHDKIAKQGINQSIFSYILLSLIVRYNHAFIFWL